LFFPIVVIVNNDGVRPYGGVRRSRTVELPNRKSGEKKPPPRFVVRRVEIGAAADRANEYVTTIKRVSVTGQEIE